MRIERISDCSFSAKSFNSSMSMSRLTYLSVMPSALLLKFLRSICDLRMMLTLIISSPFWFIAFCKSASMTCAKPKLLNERMTNNANNSFLINAFFSDIFLKQHRNDNYKTNNRNTNHKHPFWNCLNQLYGNC